MDTLKQTRIRSATRERRVEYRLHYPPELSPTLNVGAQQLQVLDISENGIRFVALGQEPAAVGQEFLATIRFQQGGEFCRVVGKVVRVSGCDIGAKLERGFDFRTIAREHDWIMMHAT
ncbi:MAG: PilZ domain-containing protein [Nevskia sp.]|nr:PilZ domain-containing protein [Nevskia sp.]